MCRWIIGVCVRESWGPEIEEEQERLMVDAAKEQSLFFGGTSPLSPPLLLSLTHSLPPSLPSSPSLPLHYYSPAFNPNPMQMVSMSSSTHHGRYLFSYSPFSSSPPPLLPSSPPPLLPSSPPPLLPSSSTVVLLFFTTFLLFFYYFFITFLLLFYYFFITFFLMNGRRTKWQRRFACEYMSPNELAATLTKGI